MIGAFYRISLPFTVLRLNLLQPEAFFLSLMTHTDFDNGDHIMKQLLLVNIGYFLSPSQPLQISLSVKVSTLYTTLSFGGFSEVFFFLSTVSRIIAPGAMMVEMSTCVGVITSNVLLVL